MELTNFKHSKKLKELGIKQKSASYWIKPIILKGCVPWITKHNREDTSTTLFYSAYTVTELLDLLPVYLKTEYTKNNTEICRLNIVKSSKYTVGYLYTYKEDKKLINALAKLFIHILKQ